MVDIIQYRYGADNLGYILYSPAHAMAVDPGDPDFVMEFLEDRHLRLRVLVNTHSHYDHTLGNSDLERYTGVRRSGFRDLVENGCVKLGDEVVRVLPTPGHTSDSVCFVAGYYNGSALIRLNFICCINLLLFEGVLNPVDGVTVCQA